MKKQGKVIGWKPKNVIAFITGRDDVECDDVVQNIVDEVFRSLRESKLDDLLSSLAEHFVDWAYGLIIEEGKDHYVGLFFEDLEKVLNNIIEVAEGKAHVDDPALELKRRLHNLRDWIKMSNPAKKIEVKDEPECPTETAEVPVTECHTTPPPEHGEPERDTPEEEKPDEQVAE
jgi:hypothetical protein